MTTFERPMPIGLAEMASGYSSSGQKESVITMEPRFCAVILEGVHLAVKELALKESGCSGNRLSISGRIRRMGRYRLRSGSQLGSVGECLAMHSHAELARRNL